MIGWLLCKLGLHDWLDAGPGLHSSTWVCCPRCRKMRQIA